MWKPILKWTRRIILTLGLFGLLALVLPRLITTLYAAARIYSAGSAPYRRVAIVFGAGLRRDGTPTGILRERVETGAQLYFAGRVEKLLLSGDNRTESYNEPEAMRQYALSLGVPADALVLDYAGRRTYDTCYRAMAIFGLEQAILVTQKFHLPRALFTCNALGLQAVGVEAGGRYRRLLMLIWNVREQLATLGAFSDIYIERPVPVLGRREPIFAESQ
jgi:vancomycin permeability regulator SanA